MRNLLRAIAVVAGGAILVASASAADLGSSGKRFGKKPPPDPIVYRQPFSWTGLYVGGQIGLGWGNEDSGFVGGVHLGYNWQSQNLVYGVETDIELTNITGNGSNGGSDWVGSTRGRLGIAYDHRLFYATAGVAYADVGSGFTVGAGIEQIISDRMTLRLEYRFTDLSNDNHSVHNGDADFHAIRAGFSYKF